MTSRFKFTNKEWKSYQDMYPGYSARGFIENIVNSRKPEPVHFSNIEIDSILEDISYEYEDFHEVIDDMLDTRSKCLEFYEVFNRAVDRAVNR
jgi:hypothetical protein